MNHNLIAYFGLLNGSLILVFYLSVSPKEKKNITKLKINYSEVFWMYVT